MCRFGYRSKSKLLFDFVVGSAGVFVFVFTLYYSCLNKRQSLSKSKKKLACKRPVVYEGADNASTVAALLHKKSSGKGPIVQSRTPNEHVLEVMHAYGLKYGEEYTGSNYYRHLVSDKEHKTKNETVKSVYYRSMWDFFEKMGWWKSMVCLLDNLPNEGKDIPVME